MTRRHSGNVLVIEGVEQGSVFPTDREETLKQVLIDGREEPFDVKGGAYASHLSVTGPGTVRGSVLAGGDLRIEAGEGEVQKYLSGISAQGSFFCTATSGNDLLESPAATPTGVRFVVRGDVVASDQVELNNAFVIGSVIAPSVTLVNSIVLGAVFTPRAPGFFHTVNSTFGMYDVKRIVIEGATTVVLAGGRSRDEPEFQTHDRQSSSSESTPSHDGHGLDEGNGAIPPRMRLLPLCRIPETGCGLPDRPLTEEELPDGRSKSDHKPGMSCAYWVEGSCPFQSEIELFPADFIQATTEVADRGEDGPVVRVSRDQDSDGAAWFFGTQSRALHFEKMEEMNRGFQRALNRIFAYEHLQPSLRENLLDDLINHGLSMEEARLFSLATEGLEGQN